MTAFIKTSVSAFGWWDLVWSENFDFTFQSFDDVGECGFNFFAQKIKNGIRLLEFRILMDKIFKDLLVLREGHHQQLYWKIEIGRSGEKLNKCRSEIRHESCIITIFEVIS